MRNLIVIIAALGLGACAKSKMSTNAPVVQNCTVTQDYSGALISCPDGSEILLPPNVVNVNISITEIVIKRPKKKKDSHHNENNH